MKGQAETVVVDMERGKKNICYPVFTGLENLLDEVTLRVKGISPIS